MSAAGFNQTGCNSGENEDRRKCALCNTSLGEEAVMALNRLWHPEHFICNSCKKPIRQTFQAADNAPYCVQCFSNKFNPRCAGCKETLVDTCLLALDKHWHPRCFCCQLCGTPLPNGEFYLVEDKPYDLDCHWQKRLDAYKKDSKKRHSFLDHNPNVASGSGGTMGLSRRLG